jgi:hypothetical protein
VLFNQEFLCIKYFFLKFLIFIYLGLLLRVRIKYYILIYTNVFLYPCLFFVYSLSLHAYNLALILSRENNPATAKEKIHMHDFILHIFAFFMEFLKECRKFGHICHFNKTRKFFLTVLVYFVPI